MTTTASWFHVSMKTMGRSAGRSVVAAAAYRLGTRLHEQEVDQAHDYRRRSGVAVTFTCAPSDAPEWAHDPERLWNAANAAEKRKNSTLAREIELALPAAVSAEAREGIARAVAQELVTRYGVAVSGAIHEPSRGGDQRNHHAHLLFTTRRMEADGLGAKTRVLDAKATGPQEVTYLRAFACDQINAALEEAGSDERVDHRSFATRGIDAEPTEHLGPGGTALERRGDRPDRGESSYTIVGGNQRFHELVGELAALNAEIAAEEERRLDERFGFADPPSLEPPPPPAPGPEPPPIPPPEPEPVRTRAGFAERAKRTLASWFGKSTEPEVPTEDSPTAPAQDVSQLAALEPTGAWVSAEVFSLGSRWTDPTETGAAGKPLSERGEQALAAFFRDVRLVPSASAPEADPLPSMLQPPFTLSSLPWPVTTPTDPPEANEPIPAVPEPLAQIPPISPGDFDRVHNETISQALADKAVLDAEEATGGRFERIQAWWSNMHEHFIEWRDHLQERFHERVESIRGRWEAPEPIPEQRHSEPPMGPEP